MLSGYSSTTLAFASDSQTDNMPICWACFIGKVGPVAAERFRIGLAAGLGDWERMCRFELDHMAVERGYEEAAQYHDCCEVAAECQAARVEGSDEDDDGAWFCARCAQTACFDCGVRLDTAPVVEERIKAATEAEGRVFW